MTYDIYNLIHTLRTYPNADVLQIYEGPADEDGIQMFKTVAALTLPHKTKPFTVVLAGGETSDENNADILGCLYNSKVPFSIDMECQDLRERTMDTIRKLIDFNPHLANLALGESVDERNSLKLTLCSLSTNSTVKTFKAPLTFGSKESFSSELCQLFAKNKTLEAFTLNNTRNVEISEECAEALINNTTLTMLEMCLNSIGYESCVQLGKVLQQNNTLRILDLSINHLGSTSMDFIIASVARNTSLTELNLSDNFCDYQGFSSLGELFQHNTALKILNLSGNVLNSSENTSYVSHFKQGFASLYYLDLSDCDLKPEEITEIGLAMKTNADMISLNLGKNHFSEENALVFADMLAHNTTLEQLHLNRSTISDSGFLAIADVVSKNNTLLILSLDTNNDITPSILLSGLQKLITPNSNLARLIINCRAFKSEEFEVLMSYLLLNSSLIELYLSLNIANYEQRKFNEITSRNKHNKKMREMTLFDRLLENTSQFNLTKQTFFDI